MSKAVLGLVLALLLSACVVQVSPEGDVTINKTSKQPPNATTYPATPGGVVKTFLEANANWEFDEARQFVTDEYLPEYESTLPGPGDTTHFRLASFEILEEKVSDNTATVKFTMILEVIEVGKTPYERDETREIATLRKVNGKWKIDAAFRPAAEEETPMNGSRSPYYPNTPAEVVKTFLEANADWNFDEARRFITDEYKSEYDSGLPGPEDTTRYRVVSFEVFEETISGDSAIVKFNQTLEITRSDGSKYEREPEGKIATLDNIDGKWKISAAIQTLPRTVEPEEHPA